MCLQHILAMAVFWRMFPLLFTPRYSDIYSGEASTRLELLRLFLGDMHTVLFPEYTSTELAEPNLYFILHEIIKPSNPFYQRLSYFYRLPKIIDLSTISSSHIRIIGDAVETE